MKRDLTKLFTLTLLGAIALHSCQRDYDLDYSITPQTTNKIVLSGEIDQDYGTRVDDGGFCDGDQIGIYVVDYEATDVAGVLETEGNRADNAMFTYDESSNSWSTQTDIYYKDSETHIDLIGYYPYASPTSVDEYSFEVQQDQSQGASYGVMGGYEASDFLWGKAENVSPTASIIRLSFNHMMASICVTLIEGTGFESGEWSAASKQVLINNTARKSSIDLSTGEVTASSDVESTGIVPYTDSGDHRAIVVPQTIASSTSLLSITIDGIVYNYSRSLETTYSPSKLHNFGITINKKESGEYEFVLTSESITAWTVDSASHDSTAKEYVVVDVAEAGELSECIAAAGKDYTTLKNLKITGQINATDFFFMRDDMSSLQCLNLKEVEIVEETISYTTYAADEIPKYALSEKTSLLRLTLPDKLTKINMRAFYGCTFITGSLIIPEGVTEVGSWTFASCQSLTGTLSLPSTLEVIEENAFYQCGFICNLTLPSSITTIEAAAFSNCQNLYGELLLPDGLTIINEQAFYYCSSLYGSLVIPDNVKEIGHSAFFMCSGFDGTLTFPKGLETIGYKAFYGAGFKGELSFPENLITIGSQAFLRNNFSGDLIIPNNLAVIGSEAFYNCSRLSGVVTIPETLLSLGSGAFYGCTNIEGVIFNSSLESIPSQLLYNCYQISSIKSLNPNPPYVGSDAFSGVPKDNFTVEVPDGAVAQYQTAAGWADFKSISVYEDFSIERSTTSLINTAQSRELILDADAAWEISSCPDWITVTPASGSLTTTVTLAIAELTQGDGDRTGEVVFKLTDKEYTTTHTVNQYDYDYAEDQCITLQTASKGDGVDIVIVGDGFSGEDISDGTYLSIMNSAMENYFGLPPYDTYRDYFNVYAPIAVSHESGIGSVNTIVDTRFSVTYTGGVGLGHTSDFTQDDLFEYVEQNTPITNVDETLIIMIPNSSDYGGICYMWEEGAAIAYCPLIDDGYPYDFRGIIQHEAGGHGFGKFADEYIYVNAYIDYCTCTYEHDDAIRTAQALGWYQNLSLSGKVNEVPWSEFIFHEKYSSTVDIYEGGFFHTRNVYRSESNSCMNNNVPYYSSVCRREIVKRIMDLAGETYSFDEFVANDDLNAGSTVTKSVSSTATPSLSTFSTITKIQANPQFMGKRKK